jgi:hypothetical protein
VASNSVARTPNEPPSKLKNIIMNDLIGFCFDLGDTDLSDNVSDHQPNIQLHAESNNNGKLV